MTTTEVLKLIDAGFTAEEIRGMQSPATPAVSTPEIAPEQTTVTAEPAPAPAPTPEDPAPAEAAPAPGPDPLDDIKQQIAGLASTVKEMSKSIITPNMTDIKPQGIEDVISNFFKEE